MGSSVPHDFAVSIEPADIDFMGHVNNASYLKWVQAAVLSHWRRIAPPDAVAAHLWVALKHEITYRKPAFLEDQIVATVMLEKVQRESAFYETVITRGEEVLAEEIGRAQVELQSLMRISYAVFCLKKTKKKQRIS